MEFRGFVKNNQLNALSQYNHLFLSDNLLENGKEISNQILKVFNSDIQEKMKQAGIHDYVIDFAYTPTKIWVIEINPFLETTDGALFSWQKERDLLENGPFEFRIREKKSFGAKSQLAISWREVFDQVIEL